MNNNCSLGNRIIEASSNPNYFQSENTENLTTREASIGLILDKLDSASKKKLLNNLGITQNDWSVFESVWMKL